MNNLGKYLSTSTFCDDIRLEIEGKLSYMGIYKGKMYFPNFPSKINTIFVVTQVNFLIKDAPKIINFKYILNGKTILEREFNTKSTNFENRDGAIYGYLSATTKLEALKIEEAGTLLVETNVDDAGWVRAGRLVLSRRD